VVGEQGLDVLITLVPSERSSSLRITTTLRRWSARLERCMGFAAEAPTAPKTSSVRRRHPDPHDPTHERLQSSATMPSAA